MKRIWRGIGCAALAGALAGCQWGEKRDAGRPEGFLPPEVVTKDWTAYKKRTEKLVAEKRYAEALEHYQWFVDHFSGDWDMTGGHRIWGFGGWARLGRLYPPARTALAELRDRREEALDALEIAPLGKESVSDRQCEAARLEFYDIASINRYLGEEERTLALFRRLDAGRPGMAVLFWPYLEGWMIDRNEMELVKKYMPDIEERWRSLKEHIGKTPGYPGRIAEEDARRLIKAARAVGRTELADRIGRELQNLLREQAPSVPAE